MPFLSDGYPPFCPWYRQYDIYGDVSRSGGADPIQEKSIQRMTEWNHRELQDSTSKGADLTGGSLFNDNSTLSMHPIMAL